jgi:hypothetical protein
MEGNERLFGIRCEDGGIIPCETSSQRDSLWDHMRKANGMGGCRIPAERLHRVTPNTDWVAIASPTTK